MYSRKCFAIITSLIILFVSVLSFPTFVYAFDEKYTEDFEQWSEIKQFIFKESDDNSTVYAKCMSNTDDACFYLYVYYLINDEDNNKDDSIKLDFDIYNDKTNYNLVIDNSPKYDAGELKNKFSILRNFTKIDKDNIYNEFIVAFEFKNKQDKTLVNYINCKLSINNSNSYDLINKYKMDMYVPVETTAKVTTTKHTTQKTTKQITTKSAATKQTTIKLTTSKQHSTKEKSTKFIPSNKVTKSSRRKSSNNNSTTKFTPKNKGSVVSTTKFSPSAENTSTEKSTKFDPNSTKEDTTDVLNQYYEQDTSEYQYSLKSRKLKRSKKAKALTVLAAVLGFLGVLLIIIGTVSGKYKIVKNENKDSSTQNEED